MIGAQPPRNLAPTGGKQGFNKELGRCAPQCVFLLQVPSGSRWQFISSSVYGPEGNDRRRSACRERRKTMTTVSSAGVLGLVAIPPASRSNHWRDAPQVSASLLEPETSLCGPLGVEAERTAMRAASFLVTAAALSCLFVGVALAIMAKSLDVANAQSALRGVSPQ